MTQTEQQKNAKLFAENWKDKGDEKQETQRFWIGILGEVLGVVNPQNYIEFEKKVKRVGFGDDASSRCEGNFISDAGRVSTKVNSKIEQTAQNILDARAKYPDSSLADLYGENMFMFPELVKAHEANDKAVMQAYGFDTKMTEAEVVAELFKMYERLSGHSSTTLTKQARQ